MTFSLSGVSLRLPRPRTPALVLTVVGTAALPRLLGSLYAPWVLLLAVVADPYPARTRSRS